MHSAVKNFILFPHLTNDISQSLLATSSSCLSSGVGITHMACSDPRMAGKCAYSVDNCFPRGVLAIEKLT